MNWYYAVGQDQKGPVTEEQLQALVKDGVVTGDTLVWREGLANWQAYRTLAAPGTLPGASPMTSTTASASATVGTDSPRTLTESEFFATDYAVRIGENLSRAWRAFTGHAGVMIGSGLLVMFIIMVVSVIPFLGGIIGIFINGVALFDYRDGVAWNTQTNALCGGPGNPPCPDPQLLPDRRGRDRRDRKSTRLNSSHVKRSRMPSSA